VAYVILVVLELSRRVDSSTFSIQRLLMENGNDRDFLSVNISPDSANFYIIKTVVIDALDVHLAMHLKKDSNVVTGNTSITASINKGVLTCGVVIRHDISHMHLDFQGGLRAFVPFGCN
jgi:hypothetical protein